MQNDPTSDKKALEKSIEADLAALHAAQKLSEENGQLKEEITSLKNRIAWFEKQIFGQTSEKRVIDNPHQASLLSEPTERDIETTPKKRRSRLSTRHGQKDTSR